MAGDWIRMRLDLDEDPAVIQMAERLGINEICVVGYCWKVWCWVSRQCNADTVTGVTLEALGRVTRTGNFPQLMADVGWLQEVEIDGKSSIKIANYDRWLSQGSKQRALTARRVQQHRDEKCNGASVTKALPEKRREEKRRVLKKTPLRGVKEKPADAGRACSLDEVREFFREKGTTVDPEQFWAYYEANGWRQSNGNRIKNWRACLTTWESRETKNGKIPAIPKDFRI